MTFTRQNIPLTDEFTERVWENYDSYDPVTKEHLTAQHHVDLRTFTADSSEGWIFSTSGSFGTVASLANYPALEMPVEASKTSIATSITLGHIVDLETGFGPNDILTFALPSFPQNAINATQSVIDITSDAEGNCANVAKTVTVGFNTGLAELTPPKLVGKASPTSIEIKSGEFRQGFNATLGFTATIARYGGNRQFAIRRSLLEGHGLNLKEVTAVRFRITGELGTSTVFIMGLKLIAAPNVNPEVNPGWERASVDFDNWNGRIRKPSPVNGDVSVAPVFTQGGVWRSQPLSGEGDPKPLDTEVGVSFNTGSQKSVNGFAIFFRQTSKIFQSQIDLRGQKMSELDGRSQPDVGTIQFNVRPMSQFEGESMEQFDNKHTMESLERTSVPNPLQQSWIYFTLMWGPEEHTLIMANTTNPGYKFTTPVLENNKNYFFVGLLEGHMARVQLYKLNADFSVVQEPIFDTTLLEDDNVFRRRRGRFGWQANLSDNDAFVRSIRTRNASFGEYKSFPLNSFTPVDGAKLFAQFNNHDVLTEQELIQYPLGTTAAKGQRDSTRSTSGESYRLTTKGVPNVGWTTPFFTISNLNTFHVEFNLWYIGQPLELEQFKTPLKLHFPALTKYPSTTLYPAAGETGGILEERRVPSLIVQLVSTEGTITQLPMPEIEPNQWQPISIKIPPGLILQSGKYQLRILQQTKLATNWWVDNFQIHQHTVQWSARSVVNDPWMSNFAPWTDFHEIVNTEFSGILLNPRGSQLQLRGKALRQDSTFRQPRVVPRYAELGRLVWPEEKRTDLIAPEALFRYQSTGPSRTFQFTDESKQEEIKGGLTTPPSKSVVLATFPTIPITENFRRIGEEEPLSNGGKWTLITGYSNVGKIFFQKYGVKEGVENSGAYWNVAVQENPAASISFENGAVGGAQLWVCIQAGKQSGYRFSLVKESGSQYSATLYRFIEGTSKVLGEVKKVFVAVFDSIGMTVRGGIITLWHQVQIGGKVVGGGEWVRVLEASDSTYTKGYSGVALEGVPHSNEGPNLVTFSTGETPSEKGLPTLIDTFKHTSENPIAGKWGEIHGFESAGQILEEAYQNVSNGNDNAYWKPTEYRSPFVTASISKQGLGKTSSSFSLWACVQEPTTAKTSGYRLVVVNTSKAREYGVGFVTFWETHWQFELLKYVEGVAKTIANSQARAFTGNVEETPRLGISAQNGIIAGWMQFNIGPKWELMATAEDSSYKTGFIGIGENGITPGLMNNLEVIEVGKTEPITAREWNFGDGTEATGNRPTIVHQYEKAGTYTATETVTNRYGQAASFSEVITVF